MSKLQQRMADAGYVRSSDPAIVAQAAETVTAWRRYQREKWQGGAEIAAALNGHQQREQDDYAAKHKLPF